LLLAQLRVQEDLHGKQVREKSLGQSGKDDARTQTRHAPQRRLRQESDEQEASNRHRPLGSQTRRRQGPTTAEVVLEEGVIEEGFVFVEEGLVLEEDWRQFEEGFLVKEDFLFEEGVAVEEGLVFEEDLLVEEELQLEEDIKEEVER
jgi:hypothetical protein